MIKFIAFGGGQCSSVLPFLLDDYDYIIFANPGYEHPITYVWIEEMKKLFPEKFIQIDTNMPETIQHHPPICTKKYKIEPIRRWLRDQGVKEAIKYLGITYEERHRVKENRIKWIKNEYPLVKWKMTRKDCQKYLIDNIGFVPVRSGCIICKYYTERITKPNPSLMNFF